MINTLSSLVASRIAAGEVVEKPASCVREAIDNSIDAGSFNIKVFSTDGGIVNLCIIDDGKGFLKEDLKKVGRPYSTSKIKDIDDLYKISTMGFRGEAISSFVSVAKVSIESNGYGINLENEERSSIYESNFLNGAKITIKDLFSSLPARKNFLSTPLGEMRSIKRVIEEKALSFPMISFTYCNNDNEVLYFPIEKPEERISRYFGTTAENINKISKTFDDFVLTLYYLPFQFNRDRGKIKIYVNSRPVVDQALVQTICYSFSSVLPGGHFPCAVLFIKIDSKLVDFNISPTKHLCKIRPSVTITSSLNDMIKSYLLKNVSLAVAEPKTIYNCDFQFNNKVEYNSPKSVDNKAKADIGFESSRKTKFESVLQFDKKEKFNDSENINLEKLRNTILKKSILTENEISFNTNKDWSYIGQAFNLFLIVQKGEELLFIDQHAACERVLYDKIRTGRLKTPLLFPRLLVTNKALSENIIKNLSLYKDYGIEIFVNKDGNLELLSLPSILKNDEKLIEQLESEFLTKEKLENILWAKIACVASIKKGDTISDVEANELLREVFKLDNLICPHGRVFASVVKLNDLVSLVGRD